MERKNGIFYMSAINLCVDYHLTGNGPQAPRLAWNVGKRNSVQLDKYGLPAWMGLDCDVRGLRPSYRVGLCKIDGVSVVKQTRTDSPRVPNVYYVKMLCRGELEEWPSVKFAVESGIISSAEPPQNPGAKKENQFGSLELCGNQISDASLHRRNVVSVTASARWRGDCVEIPRHRRVIVSVTASARWRENPTHWLISTQAGTLN